MNMAPLYRTVSLLAPWIPRGMAYALARQASGWACRRNHAVRETLSANLRVVLDYRGTAWTEAGLEQIVRRNFVNFGKFIVDFFRVGKCSDKALNALIRQENPGYLEQCRGMHSGIIGLTAHIGNWELGSSVLAMGGQPVNAIVLQQSSAGLDALFQSRRIRRGLRILPMSGAAASVPACLKRNELIVLLADLDFTRSTHRVLFFGKPAPLPRGPAVLAVRYQVPILPGFVLRQADDTFRFRFYPPILPEDAGSVEAVQHRICTVLEEVIADHPDQWFAFKPLWNPV